MIGFDEVVAKKNYLKIYIFWDMIKFKYLRVMLHIHNKGKNYRKK